MTRSGIWLPSAAVIALTVGITSRADVVTEMDRPLPPGSFIVAADNAAETAQIEQNAQDSAKMGKEEGTQEGSDLGATPENETDKVDQPARRNQTTGSESGNYNGTPR
jgi:hypothetical protein